jgi:hypothetical protein
MSDFNDFLKEHVIIINVPVPAGVDQQVKETLERKASEMVPAEHRTIAKSLTKTQRSLIKHLYQEGAQSHLGRVYGNCMSEKTGPLIYRSWEHNHTVHSLSPLGQDVARLLIAERTTYPSH